MPRATRLRLSQSLNYHKKPPYPPQELGKPGSNKNYLLNM